MKYIVILVLLFIPLYLQADIINTVLNSLHVDALENLKLTLYSDADWLHIDESFDKFGLTLYFIIAMIILVISLLIYSQYINRALKTKQKELNEVLHSLNQQKLALDAHAIISITDVKGNITYVNDKFVKISGFEREELIGQNHKLLNSAQHDANFWKKMYEKVSHGEIWKNPNICNVRKDGSYYWVDTVIVPFMKDDKPTSYVAIRTDITENKEIESELEQLYNEAQEAIAQKEELLEEIEHLAYFDALTQIPNRLHIMESFEKLLASAVRHELTLSLMFIDLDGFKLINDTLDHETGDKVLVESAKALKMVLRKDDFYGRLGGDEFVVIALGIKQKEHLEILCKKLLDAINTIELPSPVNESFGASIGVIYTIPTQKTSTHTLLKESDAVMYSVKNKGKNSFIINDKISFYI